MPETRKKTPRSKVLHVRVNEKERAALLRLAASIDEKPSRVLRRLIREAVTGGPDFFDDGLHELRTAHGQLAAVGRNINQLAKAANRHERVVPKDLRTELADAGARVEDLARLYREALVRARARSAETIGEGRAR